MIWGKTFLITGGVAGAAGVVLGALAAHALKTQLAPAALDNVQTASAYLLVHGLLLVVIAFGLRLTPEAWTLRIAGSLVLAGILCFGGGLSIAALTGVRAFSMLAPAGGMALIGGWLMLAVSALNGIAK